MQKIIVYYKKNDMRNCLVRPYYFEDEGSEVQKYKFTDLSHNFKVPELELSFHTTSESPRSLIKMSLFVLMLLPGSFSDLQYLEFGDKQFEVLTTFDLLSLPPSHTDI